LVGGCDIVKDLFASGELARLLEGAGAPVRTNKPPSIRITSAAARAFEQAAADAPGDVLRLEIDPAFSYDLHFAPRVPGDVEVKSGALSIYVGASSAGRADGMSIDYLVGKTGPAFKIENPNEPPRVKRIGPAELEARLDAGTIELYDVRPDAERAIASIGAARKLDAETQAHILSLPKDTAIAFHCHHGIRSRAAAEALLREGFTDVYNLEGGIDAWSNDVDPSIPRY